MTIVILFWRKKDSYKKCTTLEKVEWICTVSLRLVEWFTPYPQTLLKTVLSSARQNYQTGTVWCFIYYLSFYCVSCKAFDNLPNRFCLLCSRLWRDRLPSLWCYRYNLYDCCLIVHKEDNLRHALFLPHWSVAHMLFVLPKIRKQSQWQSQLQ